VGVQLLGVQLLGVQLLGVHLMGLKPVDVQTYGRAVLRS
jgi:hypothetical protein